MSERDFRLYLADIIESGTAVQKYIQGYSFQDFSRDRKTYSAVIREFEIVWYLHTIVWYKHTYEFTSKNFIIKNQG